MANKRYKWNTEKNQLEEVLPGPPSWYIPINHDPDLFKRGMGEIREKFGSGGKDQGYRLSPEKKRRR